MNSDAFRVTAFTILLTPFALVAAGEYQSAQSPQTLFHQLDRNSNQRLEGDEISESQRPAFERLLRMADRNNDAQLTFEEYNSAFTQNSAPQGDAGVFNVNRSPVDDLKQLDLNGDGKVSKSEIPVALERRFEAIFERMQSDEIDLELLERRTRQFDQLRSRMINNGQMPSLSPPDQNRPQGQMSPMTSMNRPPAVPAEFQRARALIQRLDANGNRQLDPEELENAAKVLRSLDTNGNWKVEASELLER